MSDILYLNLNKQTFFLVETKTKINIHVELKKIFILVQVKEKEIVIDRRNSMHTLGSYFENSVEKILKLSTKKKTGKKFSDVKRRRKKILFHQHCFTFTAV